MPRQRGGLDAAATPRTPAGAHITELADRLRVRLYAAEHPG